MEKLLRKYFIIILLLPIALSIALSGCQTKPGQSKPQSENPKIKAVASVYPVYAFAKEVGGDKIVLSMITPFGILPHDFEPTPRELINIKSADIFFYHGANFEPWVLKLITKDILGNALPVEISENIPLLKSDNDGHAHRHEGIPPSNFKETEAPHALKAYNNNIDPHIWLDPVRAMKEVENIAKTLAAQDPGNASYYQNNAARFNKQLAELHEEFSTVTANAHGKELVVNHAAFGYLADRYGLKQVAVMGLAPDAEPTPETIANIINFCRSHQVKYIFAEANSGDKLARSIARETGAKILFLNTIETLSKDDLAQNKNYLSIMRENLAALSKTF